MEKKWIPVNTPSLNGNEKAYINECIDSGWISSEGPFVKLFEEQLADKSDRKYGIAVSNGSSALDTAILALGIGKDDEVILPCFTIISCVSAVIRAGANPVLVDANPITLNMEVSQIEQKISSKTKAIMVVHIYGLPVDMDPIIKLATKYNLKIIEDNAEEIGQTYRGKKCGSFGDISTFSFYPNKHITTGEGGMILTDNEQLADKCRSLRNLCFKPEKRFVHDELGFNFRMTNMQAALGVAQLEKLDESVKRKREIGKLYTDLLKDIKGIQLPLQKTEYSENIYWVYSIILNSEININAEQIIQILKSEGIESRPFFYPLHLQPFFKKSGRFKGEKYPVSEYIGEKGFYIPSGIGIKNEEIKIVSDVLHKILH